MADSVRTLYLFCYDIADPKRLGRVHRILKRQGLPVQYSVFSVLMRRPQMLHLLDVIDRVIDQVEDDVRCYPLPAKLHTCLLGRQFFPDDVLLFIDGVEQLFV